jgi:hypothetical protein
MLWAKTDAPEPCLNTMRQSEVAGFETVLVARDQKIRFNGTVSDTTHSRRDVLLKVAIPDAIDFRKVGRS